MNESDFKPSINNNSSKWSLLFILGLLFISINSHSSQNECHNFYTEEFRIALDISRRHFDIQPEKVIANEMSRGRNLVAAYSTYLRELKSKFFPNSERGVFSGEDVFIVAHRIQEVLKRNHISPENSYTLFGSFPNGKAGLKSDLDIMASLQKLGNGQRNILSNAIREAINQELEKRSFPKLPINFEPVSEEYRGDFAGFNTIFIEVRSTGVWLLLAPQSSIKKSENAYFGKSIDLDRDSIRIPL